jgi:tRNA threonylcarbamoyladenosine biosynthesis protein TsaB
VIADAQRGDLYAATFERLAPDATLVRSSLTEIVPLERWAALLPAGTFVLGPALSVPRIASGIPSHVRRSPETALDWPNPMQLVDLALEIWRSGRRDDIWFLEPVYLRRSAAEEQWERKDEA